MRDLARKLYIHTMQSDSVTEYEYFYCGMTPEIKRTFERNTLLKQWATALGYGSNDFYSEFIENNEDYLKTVGKFV